MQMEPSNASSTLKAGKPKFGMALADRISKEIAAKAKKIGVTSSPLPPAVSCAAREALAEMSVRLRNYRSWSSRRQNFDPVPICVEAADLIDALPADRHDRDR